MKHYFLIDGEHPANYAVQWGSTFGDGPLFYNCCDMGPYGQTIANPNWTSADWGRFAAACIRQRDIVAKGVESGDDAYEYADIKKLDRLAQWGAYQAKHTRKSA